MSGFRVSGTFFRLFFKYAQTAGGGQVFGFSDHIKMMIKMAPTELKQLLN